MSNIKYRFAYDQNNNIVNIEDLLIENRNDSKYYCISCGAEMIAKMGEINAHHFAHKEDRESCSLESYLHKLAKKLIKKTFETSDAFKIVILQKEVCQRNKTCKFYSEVECYEYKYKTFDLKQYYDSCQEEVQIDNFRADLLLTDSAGKYKDPILIEIKVSHKCTPEKIKSGYRIIEISIKEEKDIVELCKQTTWEYDKKKQYYNFKDVDSKLCLEKKKIYRTFLKANGWTDKKETKCSDIQRKYQDSILELNVEFVNSNGEYQCQDIPIAYEINKGNNPILYKSCRNCKFGHIKINSSTVVRCEKSDKRETPEFPNLSTAKYCKYYSEDRSRYEAIIPYLTKVVIEEIK